ncbi:MAG: adenylosuccinate synthase [Firmicutes bacterium]|nr:adenylosuccinate synthase [Bacillota bacterium]MCL1953502.1 adenylosuccinate synthase [Bacillota bacterium]
MKNYNTTIIVGAQWGDEGKGKIADILASDADMVVRAQGGNNAGHTLVKEGKTYKLHLIPSGILYPKCTCIIGCGTVIDPKGLLQEMAELEAQGISISNLFVDNRAHITLPYHILQDKLSEQALGKSSIGTTQKGIGPTYSDKIERSGIRMSDFIQPSVFKEKLTNQLTKKNKLLQKIYDAPSLNFEQIFQEYNEYAKVLKPIVVDTTIMIYQAIMQGKNVLFEGAQGTLLDLDIGTYPYVTSSHPTSSGACVGSGIGPTLISNVIGIAKAYTTRVGNGPFATELDDATGKFIQTNGQEYGTTTGRPRRVGWLDTLILKYACRINGCTSLAINKLDTLTGITPLKIATSYNCDGKILDEFVSDISQLQNYTPNYIEIDGWTQDISNCTKFEDLPKQAQNYITTIEKLVNCPISMIGVGPSRQQSFKR